MMQNDIWSFLFTFWRILYIREEIEMWKLVQENIQYTFPISFIYLKIDSLERDKSLTNVLI